MLVSKLPLVTSFENDRRVEQKSVCSKARWLARSDSARGASVLDAERLAGLACTGGLVGIQLIAAFLAELSPCGVLCGDVSFILMAAKSSFMSSHPTILLIGLPKDHPIVPEHVRAQLDALEGQMRQKGVNFQLVGVMPDESADKLRQVLSGYETTVDGVVIGNGFRSSSDRMVQFEQLVNIVRECAPAAKLLFNKTPADTLDAVRRWFPID